MTEAEDALENYRHYRRAWRRSDHEWRGMRWWGTEDQRKKALVRAIYFRGYWQACRRLEEAA